MVKYGPLRTKTRVSSMMSPYPAGRMVHLVTGEVQQLHLPWSIETSKKVETIQYTLSGTKNRRSNWCTHSIDQHFFPAAGTSTSYWYSAASPTWRWEHMAGTLFAERALGPVKTAFNGSLASSNITTGVDVLRGGAGAYFTAVRERLEPNLTEVSIPNFLQEIGQMKMLYKMWAGRRNRMPNWGAANLSYQYGWRPTISDVSAMVSVILTVQQKLSDWNNRVGQLTLKRAVALNENISRSGVVATEAPYRYADWSGTLSRKVTCFLQYRPRRIQGVDTALAKIRAALDGFGFELNPRILWDAIPFSFVVDMFLDVGGILNNLRIDTLELPIDIVDTYLQYKESYKVNFNVFQEATPDHKKFYYSSGSYEKSFFNRMPFGISLEDSLRYGWKMPTLNQAMLLLSLASLKL